MVLGAGAGLGLLVVVAGVRGVAPTRAPRGLRPRVPVQRGIAATAVGVVTFAVTRWPVLAVLAVTATIAVPRVLATGRRRTAAARSEAVAQWIEMLRDTMAGAAGIEEAIVVSARRPPPAIAAAVARLAGRLEHHPLGGAVRAFALEVDDPTADLLAAALITAATNETRDLGRLLAALVEATRAQVRMRASVDAGRAQVRSATRLVLGITAAFTVALMTFSNAYLAPYATLEGQLWLAVVGGIVAASLLLLARLDRVDLPASRLVADGHETPVPGGAS